MVSIVLVAPQIAGNFGAVLRTAANFRLAFHAVQPFGFPLTEKALRRARMDYEADLTVYADWDAYATSTARRILLTTQGSSALPDFEFQPGDQLVFGNEGSGAPEAVHASVDARVRIPVAGRSLNLSVSVALTAYEALRQLGQLPNARP